MKRIMSLLLCLIISASGIPIIASPVEFKFSAGTIDAGTLKTRMETNISALLTEITRAGNNGSALNLTDINMESEAKVRLIALWDASRFVCDKTTNISKCLHDFQGYQVRAISITMKPQDSSYDQSLNRELTISLNKNGIITGVYPAWELNEDVNKILSITGTGGVMETRMRREILKWIECYRSYYYERNIEALAQIIIDGKATGRNQTDKDAEATESKVKYIKHTWGSYINNLSKAFKKNRRIKFEIDNISVVKHYTKSGIYGVTLHQTLRTNTYHEEGWLFLLWDFNDPEKPQIHVRTWQPDQVVAKDGVFTIDDFFIP